MCAARNESLAALHASLQLLPPRQRQAIKLRHLEGRPIADIAAALGCTVAAAAATVARGLRTLRELASHDE
jgi:RNA polymerase sigma-70 factor (ECF subfamily)